MSTSWRVLPFKIGTLDSHESPCSLPLFMTGKATYPPWEARTPDLEVNSLTLWPTELSRDFYAIRILWHILGAYFLLIWGVGVEILFKNPSVILRFSLIKLQIKERKEKEGMLRQNSDFRAHAVSVTGMVRAGEKDRSKIPMQETSHTGHS